jgi:hypothetical protein
MKEGLDALRILFYANLLSGQRDVLEIIEIERENDQKMAIELVKRRQRRYDNDEKPPPQQQDVSESTSETSTSSVAAAEATARDNQSKKGASTSEKSEIESPYENALQIKLGIKPNEYRYGQLPFDEFVNEYANEKIEIKREYLDFIQQTTNSIRFSFIFYPFFLSTINKTGKLNTNFIVF